MCIWPFLFMKPGTDPKDLKTILGHERIHARQQLEMLWIFFFIWYSVEYLIRLMQHKKHRVAYRNLSHEKEAFDHEADPLYLCKRKWYAWVKYL